YLNHERLWTHCFANKICPDAAAHLPELRRLLANGQPNEAMEYLMAHFAASLNGRIGGDSVDSYQPAGILTFRIAGIGTDTPYERTLDLNSGFVTITSGNVQRSFFGDPVTDRIAGEIKSEKPFSIAAALAGAEAEGDSLILRSTVAGDVHFCVIVRFSMPGMPLDGSHVFENVQSLTFELNIGCGMTAEDAFSEALFQPSGNFEMLKENRAIAYEMLQDKIAAVEIDEDGPDNALLALNYAKHLYFAGASTGTYPLNLQGKWNASPTPPWASDLHLNINLQMNYWPALPLGFKSAHETMLRFFLDHAMESGREAAAKMFGCRGIWWTWAFDPECLPAYNGGPWGIWCGVALWMAQHYYAQYEYTQDVDYLRNTGYPFLKECALFVEDFVTFREDGTAVFSPSQSPENIYKGAEKYCISLCENSTIDVELCNELLANVIAASEILGVDEDERKIWMDLKAKLPPLKIGEDGRLLEWEQPFEEIAPDHRHMSHLYAVYPGHDIDPDKTPELFAAARKSLDFRLASGGGHTGWSRAWCACFKAAFRDGNGAWNEVNTLVEHQCSDTLLDLHPMYKLVDNEWKPVDSVFQIDGNFGVAAAVVAMLLHCENGVVELLHALPDRWKNGGSVRKMRAKGALAFDYAWKDGQVTRLEIESERDTVCTVKINGEWKKLDLKTGNNVIQ
ncbi:MAG: glycoside hydrolase N-terminal domain-containing protein, partial [Lentisphaeria bacterium]|nr:glycoside hydrolase N-terminal domain-containing protein [Lentisphaeria bacterium]